jgi:hypothetical protein
MDTAKLIDALEAHILKGIAEGWSAEAIRDLAEARAWVVAPGHPHPTHAPS